MASEWRKSPGWLLSIFDVGFPADRRAQRRSMFGYPAGFVNGNLFSGLFQDSLFVRLAEPERRELLAIEGSAPFEPMAGRPMREYVVLPMEMLEDAETTRAWIRRAFQYGAALPAKTRRPASAAVGAPAKARKKTVPAKPKALPGRGSRPTGARRAAR